MSVPRHIRHTDRPARPGGSRRPLNRRLKYAALPVGVLIVATACGSGGGGGGGGTTPTPSGSPSSTGAPSTPGSASPSPRPSATPPATSPAPRPSGQALACVDRVMSGMTERQKVGQLFMSAVNASAASAAELNTLRRDAVGSVILTGHTDRGVASVRGVTDRVQSTAPTVAGTRVGLMVSTDQEGGNVQVLNGPGFSSIPPATTQGQWPTALLQQRAAEWGRQLRAAGLGVDLAPVADIVPSDLRAVNQPIGRLDREYGNDPATVARQSTAVVKGFAQAGVYATLKHYPTLGSVRGNTDFTGNVIDNVTPRNGTFLVPYRSGIDAGARFVLASLATYTKIDPHHQAVFSPTLLKSVLRGQLGFRGIVISDDLGKAVAVSSIPPGERAVGFLGAGGDMALTVDPSTVDAMTSAVLTKASGDQAFRAQLDASVRRVLDAKLDAGLLSGCSR